MQFLYSLADYPAYEGTGALLRQAVVDAGVNYADAFPVFQQEELRSTRPALYSTRDFHFSVRGAALNTGIILDRLVQTKPWKSE